MKIKYLRLNKEEKKKAKEKYYATKKGAYLHKNLKKLNICSILFIIYSIYSFIDAYLNKSKTGSVLSSIYLIIAIMFLIISRNIFIKNINEFVVKDK